METGRIAWRAALAGAMALAAPGSADAQVTRHPVAPENNWSLDDSTCTIDAGWDGDVGIVINLHNDHHDLGVYDPTLTRVKAEDVITVRFAGNGKTLGSREYQALGHRDGKMKSYVSDVDDKLLDDIARANSFQFYRGAAMDIDLDMTGFTGALAAMRACEAAQPPPADPTSAEDTPEDAGSAVEGAAAAAVAAADALENMPPRNGRRR